MKEILIIDDEDAIRLLLEDDFRFEGWNVTSTGNGINGLELALQNKYSMILLDIMLPGISGIEICKILRKRGIDTPIIMLTAKSHEIDRIVGLEIGADDYVTKPFSPKELQARVRAITRRLNRNKDWNDQDQYRFGDILIDLNRYKLLKNNEEVKLTALEFSLLRFFLKNNSRVLSRDEILDSVWKENVMVESRTVDTHVANLRKKIEVNPSRPKWIIGIRGIGYKMNIGE